MTIKIEITERQHATVLAALRMWQAALCWSNPGDELMAIASNGGALTPLTSDETGELAETVNLGAEPDPRSAEMESFIASASGRKHKPRTYHVRVITEELLMCSELRVVTATSQREALRKAKEGDTVDVHGWEIDDQVTVDVTGFDCALDELNGDDDESEED